jgi:hypothetical protein
MLLSVDPALAQHQDRRYNWEASRWDFPDQPPPTQPALERNRILPSEDANRVIIPGCTVCTNELLMAVTMRCTHLICLPCFEQDSVQNCPHCNCPKRFACLSNMGTVSWMRKSEQRQLELSSNTREAVQAVESQRANERTETQAQRDSAAIDDALRQQGIQNPAVYRQILRSRGRNQRRREGARALEEHLRSQLESSDEEDAPPSRSSTPARPSRQGSQEQVRSGPVRPSVSDPQPRNVVPVAPQPVSLSQGQPARTQQSPMRSGPATPQVVRTIPLQPANSTPARPLPVRSGPATPQVVRSNSAQSQPARSTQVTPDQAVPRRETSASPDEDRRREMRALAAAAAARRLMRGEAFSTIKWLL